MSSETFINTIRGRLTASLMVRWVLWTLIACSLLIITGGLIFIFNGRSVHHLLYIISGSVGLLSVIILYIIKRADVYQAAKKGDEHFALKDTLSTHLAFYHEKGEVFELQRQQLLKKIEPLDPKSYPVSIPKKLLTASALSVIIAGSMALIPPSQAVLDQLEEERVMLERSKEVKKQLEEEVEEIIQSLSDNEKELVDPNELRKWVKELKETKDKREALRSLARVEQKINKTLDKLDQRKDESLMKKAGLQLQKAEKSDTKELGKDLEKKDFKEAAKKLKDLKLTKKDLKDLEDLKKNKDKMDDKSLSDLKKSELQKKKNELAKLRSITKRMAEAARQQNGNKMQNHNPNNNQNGNAGKPGNVKDNQNGNGNGKAMNQDLADMLQQIDEHAEMLDEDLDEAELLMQEGEDWDDEQLDFQMGELDKELDNLRGRLNQMDAKKMMRKRLQGLQQKLGQAQSRTQGQKSSASSNQNAKDKQIGNASDNSTRDEKNELTDNGQFDKLNGLKGKGESLSTIEEATSGTGASGKTGQVIERSFEKQVDSFIERDDVPDEMKEGIKEYFKSIHQTK